MKKIFSILFAVTFLASCDSMLEVKPRASVLDTEVLNDLATTQAALNSCYSVLRNANYYGRSLVLLPEVMADNCMLVNPADRSGRGQNEATNVKGSSFVHWNTIYTTLNTANLILDAIDNNRIPITSAADQASINRIKAQALFLRALFHFDLVRAYAYNPNYILTKNGELWDYGVPIVLTPTRSKAEIQLPSRPKIVEVYKQIETDLLASVNFFTLSGTPNSAGSYFGNRAGARALLARVYLYWAGPSFPEKYQQAFDMATAAISDAPSTLATLTTTANFVTNWTTGAPHVESLFEVRFASTAENLGADNALEAWYTRRFTASGARTGWGDIVASNNLVSAYSEGTDLRANTNLLAFTSPGVRPSEDPNTRETRKYSSPSSPSNFGLDNVPVIRMAELYLIRAEAAVLKQTPDEAQARADLNTIRSRVFASPGTVTETGQALIDRLYLERRRELAFEGHRWFDFTRRGLSVSKPDGSVIPYDDIRILAPIPLDQVQANPNLKQNPGY